jgi:CXXX repeat modification system protein
MKVLAKITLEEADDIIQLIEKKNALNNLALLLEKKEGKKELLKECNAEKDMVYKQYQKWWTYILNKYKLHNYPIESIYVDAYERIVKLN